ncbi:hypothetical protein [Prosthecobacter sp.]|uniref:hypothetical protein n=1 Tax=Prosthecobacter sp. TaxID=1965333 RepID=UPI0037841AEB
MRWCLSILPCLLILLVLGAEWCTSPGAIMVKDPSHLACLLDDDNTENETEAKDGIPRDEYSGLDLEMNFAGLFVMSQCAKTEMVLSLEGTAVPKLLMGVRRHRWLCRESC